MSISLLAFLFICLAQLLLAFIVLLKNRKNFTNISFFIFTLSIIIWIVSNYFIDGITNSDTALLVMKIIFISSGLAPYALLLFSISLTRLRKKLNTKWLLILSVLPLLSLFFCINNFVIKDIKLQDGVWGVDFGSLSVVYNIYLLGYFIAALIVLFWGFRKSHGLDRTRFQYVFTGLALTVLIGVSANLLLPLLGNDFGYVVYGPYATIFTTGFVSYAIIRHKLFDIRAVVARSLTYILSIVTIATIYGFLAFRIITLFTEQLNQNTQYAIFTILAVILAFTFQPLKRFFERVTDKIFFRDKYDPQAVINTIGHILASEIRLERLVDKVTGELTVEMRVASADIVVVGDKSIFYQSKAKVAAQDYKLRDLKKLSKAIIVADDLSSGERKEIMARYGISVSLAMRTSEAFVGYLLLGEKLSGDIYNVTDLRVLRILSNELAIAIQNAKAYTEIQQFNETLQTKIAWATQKLRHANTDLKKLDEAKDEFISMASHQLRTPLTTTKGYVSMVLEGDFGKISKAQIEPLQQSLDSANRMGGLVNDLLNVSRMDAGKFFIDAHEMDLTKVVQSEFNGLISMAQSKNVKLTLEPLPKSLPLINLDEEKTRQVIMNLIDNAIHYSSPTKTDSEVKVSLEQAGQDVIFKVVDNGIGVPDKMKEHLFTKFYRASNAQAARPDGTGLGLYLVKRVVEDQGGQLIFKSTEGEGSTFGFRFPLKTKFKAGVTKARVQTSS